MESLVVGEDAMHLKSRESKNFGVVEKLPLPSSSKAKGRADEGRAAVIV